MGILAGALKLLPVIAAAVKTVERMAGARKGKEKQDAAVEIVTDLLPIVDETIVGRDLLDAKREAVIRSAIDAVVAIMNLGRDIAAARAARASSETRAVTGG